jgi:hypothetical protein
MHLTNSQKVELKRDLTVFVISLLGFLETSGGDFTWSAVFAALVAAAKVTAREVFVHDDDVAPAGDGEA